MFEENELIKSVNNAKNQTHDLLKLFKQIAEDQGTEQSPFVKNAASELRNALKELTAVATAEVNNTKLLQDLIQSSALINSSLELDQVLENLLDTITQVTGAERGYLLMLDESDGEFKTRVARNWDQENMPESDVTYSLSVIKRAVEEGQPIITDNAQADDRFETSKSVVMMNLRSIICIPLQLQGRTVGVLYADNRLTPGQFRGSLVPLLAAFATQAGIAIQNARHFERVRNDLEEANREVRALKILLNKSKIEKEVKSITESEYFSKLQTAIDEIRAEFHSDLSD